MRPAQRTRVVPRIIVSLLVCLAGLGPARSQEPAVWVASPWQHVLRSTEPGGMKSAEIVAARNEYRQSLKENDEGYSEKCLKQFNFALKDYQEARRNSCFNLGLYQSGDLNLVPLLKEIRRSIEAGSEKHVLLAMVPNTRNNDFVVQKVAPENFSGAF